MFNRRTFLKTLAFLGAMVGLKVPTLPKLRFKRKDNCALITNGPEILADMPFTPIPHGLHQSFDNVYFKWERRRTAWVDKEDALWFRNPSTISWGEVTLVEKVSWSRTRNCAAVEFFLEPTPQTQMITFPENLCFSDAKDEIRHEVDHAFGCHVLIDEFIGVS